MISCFKCKNSTERFQCLSDLIEHFKFTHNMPAHESVVCTFPSCHREFSNRANFCSHFNKKHPQPITDVRNVSESSNQITHPSNVIACFAEPDVSQGETNIENVNTSPNACESLSPSSDTRQVTTQGHNTNTYDRSIDISLQEEIINFCLEIISFPDIPFSFIELIFNRFNLLFTDINAMYEQKILNICRNFNEECSKAVASEIISLLKFVQDSFKQLQTQYRQEKFFDKMGVYIVPKPRFLGQTLKVRKMKGRYRFVPVEDSSVFIPFRTTLKVYLSQENILSSIKEFIQDVSAEKVMIKNVVQGTNWRNAIVHSDGITLSLCLFNDCFEPGNSLGSHSGCQKVNATYISLPCLPPERRGSLCNIFVGLLTKSSNLKKYSNRAIFKPVIDELKFLSNEGITINNEKIYFQLSALSGDNLGLNAIGGFTTNFSKTNFCCRVCLCNKEQRWVMTVEEEALLRNRQNYAESLAVNDMKKTGIIEPCALNEVPNFFIIRDCIMDVMHDLPEGVVKYDLVFIFQYCVSEKKYLTFDYLNQIIATLDFGCDHSSKPPLLNQSILKKKTFNLSASESMCLLKYIGIILGNIIPTEDKIWQLYTSLRRIIDIVTSPAIHRGAPELLADYVQQHHSLYMELTGRKLTIKFHNLIHYPRKIRELGPLIYFWGMRNEGKHRVLKKAATATSSRRNICLTMAKRIQLQLAFNFSTKKFSSNTIICGKAENAKIFRKFLSELNRYNLTTTVPECLEDCISTSWVIFNGTKYCKGYTLYAELDEISSLPVFGSIFKILVADKKSIYFFLKNFQTIAFHELRFAYEVKPADSFSFVEISKLRDFHPHNAVKSTYVSLLNF